MTLPFALATAHEVACRVLARLFPEDPSPACPKEGPRGGLSLLPFQQQAVERASAAMARWGGVLVCDAVGLGKTYVGLELLRRAVRAGQHTVLVIPSALRHQWVAPVRRLRAAHRVTVITHAQLSRGGYAESLVGRPGLLLVDEAHGFRSPHARRYGAIARLAVSRSVCLITATPVNNSLDDLYWLLRIWARDDRFRSLDVPHLRLLFSEAATMPEPPPAFRRLLREVMVRRARDDVEREVRTNTGSLRFPALAPPVSVTFDPDAGAPGSHAAIIRAISDLELAAVAEEATALVRYLLLKRLASSPASLAGSARRLLRYHQDFLEALDDGLLLSPSRVARGADRSALDCSQLELRRMTLRPVPASLDVERLATQARDDLERLAVIVSQLSRSDASRDDKVARLRGLAFHTLPAEKLLVFTEFRDTATYLWEQLRGHGGVALIHGGGAWLGTGVAGRSAVIRRFAPRASSASRVHVREEVRILIATDVMSEGLNLQDCGHVVSYDLPWNPVRLMQRLGRIDRLGSLHDIIHVYNFLPDRDLEEYLSLLRRLRQKLRFIEMAEGADRPVLDSDAALDSFRPAPVTERDAGIRAFSTRDEHLRRWIRDRRADSIVAADGLIPLAIMHSARADSGRLLCVFTTDARDGMRAFLRSHASTSEVDPGDVIAECIATEGGDDSGVDAHTFRRHARWCQNLLARDVRLIDRPIALRRHKSAVDVLSRRLMSAVSAVAGGPSAAQCALADRLIASLGNSHDTATERALAHIAAGRELDFEQIASSLDGLFGVYERPGTAPEVRRGRVMAGGSESPRLFAAVCLVPKCRPRVLD
ncbi:MAG: DEAD/DEAH box helicase [Longimicrobiales bacterium]